MRVAVVIPAHNEQATIGQIVGVACRTWPRVFVVDDGSTDQTALRAAQSGGTVLRHETRSGYGSALRSGLEEALKSGFQVVVTLDADGSHDPAESLGLVEEHLRHGADLTIGSRLLRNESEWFPSSKRAANRLAASILNTSLGTHLHDVLSGYRVLGPKVVEGANLSAGFGATVDLIAYAADAGLSLHEAGVEVRYDAGEIYSTACSEIRHFLESCLRLSREPLRGQIRRLWCLIGVERRIWIVLRRARYVLHRVNEADGYVVQAQHPWFPPPEGDPIVELTA